MLIFAFYLFIVFNESTAIHNESIASFMLRILQNYLQGVKKHYVSKRVFNAGI
jgi:hypothetical protein